MASSAPQLIPSNRLTPPPSMNYQSRYGGGKIDKATYDTENNEFTRRQGLSAVGQMVGPNGVTTQYGAPPQASSMSGLRSSSASSTSIEGSPEGISEDELRRIKLATGSPQEPVTRNVVNEQAGRDAAFNRAKDKAGQVAASSLRGLREALGGRGLLGGGAEGAATAELAGNTGEGLSDIVREQAIQEAGQASRNTDTEYAGQIAQRGQNQNSTNALLSLINSRGRLY